MEITFRNPIRFLAALSISFLFVGCASDQALRRATAKCPPDASFEKQLSELTDVKLLEGNSVKELVNGEEFFPAMIEAIRHAQHNVHFENFVWRSGDVSTRFIDALTERARAGVKVDFLVDALGASELVDSDLKKLRDAGVTVAKYYPITFAKLFRLNHRTHRKILIVDGKIGFVGGISMADDWLYDTDNPNRWRDSNYQIEGPAVESLQNIFAVNWAQTTGEQLMGDKNFPKISSTGSCVAGCFMSGPGEGEKNSRRVYLLALATARKNIRIAHSYFLPDDLALRLLLEARMRGVKVEIITPGVINFNVVRLASRSRWKKLLEAGVEFYEYQPTKYHLKLMIVDDLWVTAGSVNFDARSFRINDEANFIARDRDFAAKEIATFEADKSLSEPVDPGEFKRRSFGMKLLERLANTLCFEF